MKNVIKIFKISYTLALALTFTLSCKKEEASKMKIQKLPSTKAQKLPEDQILKNRLPRDEIHAKLFSSENIENRPMPNVTTGGQASRLSIKPEDLDENPIPLKKSGIGSVEELKRALAKIKEEENKQAFEEAFRLTFSPNKPARNYERAKENIKRVLEKQPDLAAIYRTMGYIEVNLGFNIQDAMAAYTKAIDLDPSYGEAHYALAFIYAMMDKEKGFSHLKKALELKVPDEQNLLGSFYKSMEE